MTNTEKLLTRLGMWGALQGFSALVAAIIGSIALLEFLTPAVARLFSSVPVNLLHVFAVGIGVLLGLIGSFAGDFWDRIVFEGFYGRRGWWRATVQRPLLVFPAGAGLTLHRTQAAQVLPGKPGTAEGIYREAAKMAKRQVERWEQIEHPLILARFVRDFLWPCLFVAFLGSSAASVFPLFGLGTETSWFLATGGGCLVLALLLLIPYSHLRVEHLARLYEDVLAHSGRRKPERR